MTLHDSASALADTSPSAASPTHPVRLRGPETSTVVGSSRRQCLLEIIPPTSSDGDARDAMAHVRGTTSVAF